MVVATIQFNPIDLSPDLGCAAHRLPQPPYSDLARPSSLLGIDFVARVSVVLRFLVCIDTFNYPKGSREQTLSCPTGNLEPGH
jgi:hypothetical protein